MPVRIRRPPATGACSSPYTHDGLAPFWGKPPLQFWLTATSYRVFGVSEWAARMPSFLLAAAIVAATVAFAACWWGSRVAVLAGIILSSSGLFLVLSGACVLDIPLTASISGAMMAFALFARGEKHRKTWGVAFFFVLAPGALAKGPVALALVGLAVGLWIVVVGRWRLVLELPWLLGLLVFFGLACALVHFGRNDHARLFALLFRQRTLLALREQRLRRSLRLRPQAALGDHLVDARRGISSLDDLGVDVGVDVAGAIVSRREALVHAAGRPVADLCAHLGACAGVVFHARQASPVHLCFAGAAGFGPGHCPWARPLDGFRKSVWVSPYARAAFGGPAAVGRDRNGRLGNPGRQTVESRRAWAGRCGGERRRDRHGVSGSGRLVDHAALGIDGRRGHAGADDRRDLYDGPVPRRAAG